MDPETRWTPKQARRHPFITNEEFTGSFDPTQLEVETNEGDDLSDSSSVSKKNRSEDSSDKF